MNQRRPGGGFSRAERNGKHCIVSSKKPDPYQTGRGLVGGRGEDRARAAKVPPFVHPMVFRPYNDASHLEDAQSFLSDGPVEIEIGFGRGHHLKERIKQVPQHRFLAFEVRRMWVERMAMLLEREKYSHVRLILSDARPLLPEILSSGQVHAFHVFFPDPWWKKRHEKRRVVDPETLKVFHNLLSDDGCLHFRTDVLAYFERVQSLLQAHGGYDIGESDTDTYGNVFPPTHREKKCVQYNQPVYKLCARKIPIPSLTEPETSK
jgi:tRNA (guanine-N7-)-methyltransferase